MLLTAVVAILAAALSRLATDADQIDFEFVAIGAALGIVVGMAMGVVIGRKQVNRALGAILGVIAGVCAGAAGGAMLSVPGNLLTCVGGSVVLVAFAAMVHRLSVAPSDKRDA